MRDGHISDFPDFNLPPWEWGVRQGGMMNIEVMKANVLEFKEVCDKHKLTFILIFGTLLGAVRNNAPIPNDSDFDVFCFAKDYRIWLTVKSELRDRGFYIPDDKPLHDEYIIRNGEKIDINWISPFGNFYVYDEDLYYPRAYFDRLNHIKLFDAYFLAPANSEQLLADLYGDNWRTPSSGKGNWRIYKI